MTGISIALLVMITYFSYILIRTCFAMRMLVFYSMWVWLYFISNALNLTVVIMTLS